MTACPSSIVFDVPGKPRPKARPRVTSHGTYTPKAAADWEKVVGQYAFLAGLRPVEGACEVRVWLCGVGLTGDVDNYLKAILDGLNGVAYADDRQVKAAHVYKLAGRGALCRIEVVRLEAGWEEQVVMPEVGK